MHDINNPQMLLLFVIILQFKISSWIAWFKKGELVALGSRGHYTRDNPHTLNVKCPNCECDPKWG